MDTGSIYEKGTGFRGFFKKIQLFWEIVTTRRVDLQGSVQKYRKMDLKGVDSQNVSVIVSAYPTILKIDVYELRLRKSQIFESTFSHIHFCV